MEVGGGVPRMVMLLGFSRRPWDISGFEGLGESYGRSVMCVERNAAFIEEDDGYQRRIGIG
ncbi:hypothetical protein MA16_Dca010877 [Dendrobium catenatum]|uniref:Uncharacterized protein n=1 Tax=Dendrobium catenatum TaxID=906689 RepID=A0A2I0XFG3_9ASPA|nr:hypothetical protein MA16_Dca010877 [Dendrobium catenatum]